MLTIKCLFFSFLMLFSKYNIHVDLFNHMKDFSTDVLAQSAKFYFNRSEEIKSCTLFLFIEIGDGVV